jgi:hypothetical protein
MSYISQDDAPNDNCAICTEPLKDPTKAPFRLTCGHVFHNNCLNNLCEHDFPNINCPQCRIPIDQNECNTFWAFKERALYEGYLNSLPQDVQNVYNVTINQGGKHSKNRTKKSRRNKKSRHNKKSTRRRRSSIKRKY